MLYYLVKLAISATLIVLVSEVAKRSTWLGGVLASLPLVSFLSIVWLYVDTNDADKVADLSTDTFWLVLPSLTFFLALPLLLKRWTFVPSLLTATVIMFAFYGLMLLVLQWLDVSVE
jgi:hypothetical protein